MQPGSLLENDGKPPGLSGLFRLGRDYHAIVAILT
jgi:hypothetical protein